MRTNISRRACLAALAPLAAASKAGVASLKAQARARTNAQNLNIGPQLYPLTDDAFFTFPLPASAQQYGAISGQAMKQDLRELVAISLKSKAAGNQYWGRITGTPYDTMSRQWLAGKFREIGLETREEPLPLPPLWYPKQWSVTVAAGDKVVNLKTAQPIHDSASTPPDGAELEVVYVGLGTAADFAGRDVKGKAVFIFSIPEPGVLIYSARRFGAVKRAQALGAAAAFVVIGLPGNLTTQLWPRGATIPNFSLGQEDGETVRLAIEQASSGQAPKVRIRLDTEIRSDFKTASVWAELPGQTEEHILVMSHYDGFFQAAMDNASGVAVMLGLARYFSKVPKARRRRSISFVGFSTHHEPHEIWRQWMMTEKKPFLMKTALMMNCEHTSLVEWYQYGERLRNTNGIAARRVAMSGSQALSDILVKDLRLFGVRTYADADLHPAGEIRTMFQLAPGFQTLRDGAYYHSDEDTPEIVPAEGLQEVGRAYAKIIDDVNQLEIKDLRAPAASSQRSGG